MQNRPLANKPYMLSSGTLCELRITILLHIRHFNQIVRRSLVGICAKFQGHNSKE